MRNTDIGDMSKKQKRRYIANALDELPSDVLDLICRIIFYSECGLE